MKHKGLEAYIKTETDRAVWTALKDSGGDYKKMAEQLGVPQRTIRSQLHRLRKRAARQGWSPDHDLTKPVPDGYHLKGASTLYGVNLETGDLDLKLLWVKSDKDREDRVEAMQIACAEMIEPLRGRIKPVKKRKPREGYDTDLMAAYLIGDHHTGMFAWAVETGADYDTDIAEEILDNAFRRLGAAAPPAQKALIAVMGDFTHADNHSGRTPQSGHQLDTDGRFTRVIQASIRMKRRAIDFALKKHEVVEVDVLGGNHDPEASMWLAHCLSALFDNEPRVTVRTDPRAYHFTEWGKCLIGTTHGDKCKPTSLAEIMAVDAREAWGKAEFCHFYTAHVHHKWLMELRGCVVESLSVLPPGDAWHMGQGYRSQRGMQLDVWHKKYGRLQTIHGTVQYINGN